MNMEVYISYWSAYFMPWVWFKLILSLNGEQNSSNVQPRSGQVHVSQGTSETCFRHWVSWILCIQLLTIGKEKLSTIWHVGSPDKCLISPMNESMIYPLWVTEKKSWKFGCWRGTWSRRKESKNELWMHEKTGLWFRENSTDSKLFPEMLRLIAQKYSQFSKEGPGDLLMSNIPFLWSQDRVL